ncbi:MAG: 3-hydroxyacyl-CoA dehydrogenase NAD-binding domain-containing protein [Flavobacteriales bacterium]
MRRIIKKVAVVGSGVMGSRIACHFANIGVEVLLLDIVPPALNDAETAKGLTLEHKAVRNRIVNDALQTAIKSNPAPLYSAKFASRISTGNLIDDISKIKDVDWIIEVVTERLDIKRKVFESIEMHRKSGTIVTTNTSGIPIHLLIEGRSEDFVKNFCGTHFFNPPRYLKLLEIIPSPKTDAELVAFLEDYGQRFLGKTTVLCKDTPAFIANRIGVYSIQALFHLIQEMGLRVEEVDKLTGPVLGRPKSATFRTCDVVGLDTLVHVANGVRENCPNDEAKSAFEIPDFIAKMVAENRLGDKTKGGFYKKTKDDKGATKILSLNLETGEYQDQIKSKFATLEQTKMIDDLGTRIPVLYNGKDKAGEFYKKSFLSLFAYVSNRIPEIADELYKIDDAMKAGFGWALGPFEYWEKIGIEQVVSDAKAANITLAPWIEAVLAKGHKSFYTFCEGKKYFYDIPSGEMKPVPASDRMIVLSQLPESSIVWKNKAVTVRHMGDGILACSWSTKMNTIGSEVIQGIHKAIDLAEASYKGLVLYNEAEHFSAGANVGLIFMLAAEQDYEELDMAVRVFQQTTMRLRTCSVPVIAAPHSLALGGGCEISMHCDKVVAHAELYMGLVEFGVGIIPGGGGTKEFAVRCADEFKDGDIRINTFRKRFLTVGQAKVSTSAHEAFEHGYLREGVDEIVVSRELQLARAKEAALEMFNKGYVAPKPRKDIMILGQEALGIVYVGANSMMSGNYISTHDQLISEKLGYAMAGGDLSQPQLVSEQYLLDLERKAFLELCTQKKTLERMQSLITTGKILRN